MKLSIFQWDHQLGPKPLIQHPPDPNSPFPKKEILLRIWSLHELNNEPIVNFTEDSLNYLSIMNKSSNEFHFALLELDDQDNSSQFHDIFLNLSSTLFNSIGNDNFTRVLSETYSMIDEYSKLSHDQLYFNLFKDKNKVILLNSLRKGIINRKELCEDLSSKFGIAETNFDILITPFIHLGLVMENTIHGCHNYFLVQDVYGARTPPHQLYQELLKSSDEADKEYIGFMTDFFKNYRPNDDADDNLFQISKLLNDKQIFSSLEILYENKLKKNRFIDMLSQDVQSYQKLRQYKLIMEVDDFLYPLSEIHFYRFIPYYLIRTLGLRFQKNEISTEELFYHIRLLQSMKE